MNEHNEPAQDPVEPAREGDTKEESPEQSCCHRPGCYERFTPAPQSPHQKYCSLECYNAMRTVLIREERWRKRLQKKAGPNDAFE